MRAQAFTVFKMMIGAVLAVALLAMVYQLVHGLNPPYTGFEAVRELVISASNAPNKCFQRNKIVFQKDEEISREGLEANTGVGITLRDDNGVFIHRNNNVYKAKTRLEIPVTAQCSITQSDISCDVSFAETCH